ncbi:hypothetical protein AJ80_08411 [Polytolypa hystricis UAMH7299]|uniref:Uncharacterized protein n=1 Tax=Polytolypa hystricis (strain UAMH7299) TaxID=1447883 RepID=A0A2B7X8Q4_POLH7|nr:hypothetical protein AJ80_08411 [Polytolypa hystricis UAMH7299]
MPYLTVTKFALTLLSHWAVYAIFDFSRRNGLFSLIQQLNRNKALPGTDEPLNLNITGFKALDKVLAAATPFFWPLIDGSTPEASLHAFNFVGAAVGIWVLIMLEAMRKGRKSWLTMFPPLLGMLMQTATFGVVVPIYTTWHIFTSPAAENPTKDLVAMSRLDLKVLPFSVFAGFLVPSALLVLPETSVGPLQTIQERLAFWQPWPVWVSLIHFTTRHVVGVFCCGPSTEAGQSVVSEAQTRRIRSAFRYVYAFAFSCTTITHISSWTVSLSSVAFPSLYNAGLQPSLSPTRVFWNTFPWSTAKIGSLGEGVLWFLQWDHLLSAAAMLLWAIALYSLAHVSVRKKEVGRAGLLFKVLALCLVSGFAGAAVEFMWERDELLLEVERSREKVE